MKITLTKYGAYTVELLGQHIYTADSRAETKEFISLVKNGKTYAEASEIIAKGFGK
jgi:hypothetical protein